MTASALVAKTCPECNSRFYVTDGEAWKATCTSCWVAAKRGEKRELVRLREQNTRLAILVMQLRRDADRREPSNINQKMLRRLIQLCHPDKHGGGAGAVTATQWLLNQRGM